MTIVSDIADHYISVDRINIDPVIGTNAEYALTETAQPGREGAAPRPGYHATRQSPRAAFPGLTAIIGPVQCEVAVCGIGPHFDFQTGTEGPAGTAPQRRQDDLSQWLNTSLSDVGLRVGKIGGTRQGRAEHHHLILLPDTHRQPRRRTILAARPFVP